MDNLNEQDYLFERLVKIKYVLEKEVNDEIANKKLLENTNLICEREVPLLKK